MLFLDADTTRTSLSMAHAIEAMTLAFSDDVEIPLRTQLAGSMFMSGRVGAWTGVKVVSTVPGNPVGMVMVLDPEGTPIGIVDGPTLTAIRTAAGAGLATRLLAPEEASTLAMLGAGAMAFDQIEAVRTVRPIDRVLVWSRTRANAARLADRVGGEVADHPDDAVAVADIVSSATPSRRALFSDPGRAIHVNAVGAFNPAMIEIPIELTRRAYVVADDLTAVEAEAGDLIQAGKTPDTTLTDVVARRHPAIPEGTPTLFKSVGVASQDVAGALAALKAAEDRGLGVRV